MTMRCIDAIGVLIYKYYFIRNRFEYGDELREKLVRRVRLPQKKNNGNLGLRLTAWPLRSLWHNVPCEISLLFGFIPAFADTELRKCQHDHNDFRITFGLPRTSRT